MGYFSNIKNSKTYKVIKAISTSAVVALFLSFLFFTYDVYKESSQESRNKEHFDKTVDRLDMIRESLSTRFLGRFPSYLTEINKVFSHLEAKDSVIIFEDVLYYGIKSRPKEFCQFNKQILNHARQGGSVVVAYYDNHSNLDIPVWATIFHRMIVESRIDQRYTTQMLTERRNQLEKLTVNSREEMIRIDSVITESYFRKTVNQRRKRTEKEVEMYLRPLVEANTESDVIVQRMCQELDSIKQYYIGNGKTIDDIHFADYKNMYSAMTDCIVKRYQDNGIQLIPLDEYLTMSCWLLKPSDANRPTEAILAFPSKYSSDEIGFYSQDASFATYISMILKGIEANRMSQE